MPEAKDIELDAHEIPPDPKKIAKAELRGYDPRAAFFIVMSVGNLDGSTDDQYCEGRFDADLELGIEGVAKAEREAIKSAKDLNEEYPTMQAYVYKCIPIARVRRGRSIVDRIEMKK